MELKNKFKTDYNSYSQLKNDLSKLKMEVDNKHENKSFMDAISIIPDCLKYNILPFLLGIFNSNYIMNNLKSCKTKAMFKEYDNIRSIIDNGLKEYSSTYFVRKPCGSYCILEQFKSIISEDLCDKYLYFDLNNIKKGWNISDGNTMAYDFFDTITVNVKKEITHPYPDLSETIQNIFTDKLNSLIILAMSFINLYLSIQNMEKIKEELKKLEKCDKEFQKIQNDFNFLKDKINYLPDRIEDAINFIQELYYEISNVRERLMNHINSMKERIENTNKLKGESFYGMISSGIFGLTSFGMFMLSGNVQNLFSTVTNVVSVATNIYSMINNYQNYKKCNDILNQLQEKLDRANNLSIEMNKFIDTLINKLEIGNN